MVVVVAAAAAKNKFYSEDNSKILFFYNNIGNCIVLKMIVSSQIFSRKDYYVNHINKYQFVTGTYFIDPPPPHILKKWKVKLTFTKFELRYLNSDKDRWDTAKQVTQHASNSTSSHLKIIIISFFLCFWSMFLIWAQGKQFWSERKKLKPLSSYSWDLTSVAFCWLKRTNSKVDISKI